MNTPKCSFESVRPYVTFSNIFKPIKTFLVHYFSQIREYFKLKLGSLCGRATVLTNDQKLGNILRKNGIEPGKSYKLVLNNPIGSLEENEPQFRTDLHRTSYTGIILQNKKFSVATQKIPSTVTSIIEEGTQVRSVDLETIQANIKTEIDSLSLSDTQKTYFYYLSCQSPINEITVLSHYENLNPLTFGGLSIKRESKVEENKITCLSEETFQFALHDESGENEPSTKDILRRTNFVYDQIKNQLHATVSYHPPGDNLINA